MSSLITYLERTVRTNRTIAIQMEIQSAKHWKDKPDEHDFPAATDYLTLLVTPVQATKLVKALRKADLIHRKAKDILRASGLDLLPENNTHVASDLGKVRQGEKLSPVLLVRGQPLVIADGYHRVCASYWIDEDADIPCRLV